MPGDPDNPVPPPPVLRVAVLGSTGSIGTQALQTIHHLNTLHQQGNHPTKYEVVALAANADTATLTKQAQAHPSATLGISNPAANTNPLNQSNLIHSQNAATTLIHDTHPDLVISAIVGIAGLHSTLAAAQLGINIALANKESLVAAGHLLTAAAHKSGTQILPIDSEHAGLWQCLLSLTPQSYTPPTPAPPSIRRITLTASGGPFKNKALDQIQSATIDQALNHPTWSMGKKVSIDSATLMNKALELIEAHWLFGLNANQLHAVIHPQSTVHAFVETIDGSTLAHLGPTDMRCPIQHALTHPHRAPIQSNPLDLTTLGSLDFEPIDPHRFPAITLAKQAIEANDSSATVLNAANEAAVDAFLNSQLNFGSITTIIQHTLDRFDHRPINTINTLDAIMDIHTTAKAIATQRINASTTPAR